MRRPYNYIIALRDAPPRVPARVRDGNRGHCRAASFLGKFENRNGSHAPCADPGCMRIDPATGIRSVAAHNPGAALAPVCGIDTRIELRRLPDFLLFVWGIDVHRPQDDMGFRELRDRTQASPGVGIPVVLARGARRAQHPRCTGLGQNDAERPQWLSGYDSGAGLRRFRFAPIVRDADCSRLRASGGSRSLSRLDRAVARGFFIVISNGLESWWMRAFEYLWVLFLILAAEIGRHWVRYAPRPHRGQPMGAARRMGPVPSRVEGHPARRRPPNIGTGRATTWDA